MTSVSELEDIALARYIEVDYLLLSSNVTDTQRKTNTSGHLLYVDTGQMIITVEGKLSVLCQGMAIWLPDNICYQLSSVHHCQYYFVKMLSNFTWKLPKKIKLMNASSLLEVLIKRLIAHKGEVFDKVHESFFLLMVQEVNGSVTLKYHLPYCLHPKIQKLTEYILSFEDRNFSLEEAAKYLAVSSRTLTRIFKTEFGYGYGKWYQQLKLIRAIGMLQQNKSVTTAAYSLNYNSDSAFIRMFKRLTGETPAKFLAHMKLESGK